MTPLPFNQESSFLEAQSQLRRQSTQGSNDGSVGEFPPLYVADITNYQEEEK